MRIVFLSLALAATVSTARAHGPSEASAASSMLPLAVVALPSVALAGGVEVGAGALVGIGARVIPGVAIGEGAVVGAGAVVIDDVEPFTTVVGVPARPVERR